jgi:hypothetical protein
VKVDHHFLNLLFSLLHITHIFSSHFVFVSKTRQLNLWGIQRCFSRSTPSETVWANPHLRRGDVDALSEVERVEVKSTAFKSTSTKRKTEAKQAETETKKAKPLPLLLAPAPRPLPTMPRRAVMRTDHNLVKSEAVAISMRSLEQQRQAETEMKEAEPSLSLASASRPPMMTMPMRTIMTDHDHAEVAMSMRLEQYRYHLRRLYDDPLIFSPAPEVVMNPMFGNSNRNRNYFGGYPQQHARMPVSSQPAPSAPSRLEFLVNYLSLNAPPATPAQHQPMSVASRLMPYSHPHPCNQQQQSQARSQAQAVRADAAKSMPMRNENNESSPSLL